jgi:hypothetical protein
MQQMQRRIKLAMRHTWTTAWPPNSRLPLSPIHEKEAKSCSPVPDHICKSWCMIVDTSNLKTNYALGCAMVQATKIDPANVWTSAFQGGTPCLKI